jgi:peptide/nickel transport system ATP-binding protein
MQGRNKMKVNGSLGCSGLRGGLIFSIQKVGVLLFVLSLAACSSYGGRGLQPGVANVSEVIATMGEPAMRWRDADGSQQLAYPRGPAGVHTLMAFFGPDEENGVLTELESDMHALIDRFVVTQEQTDNRLKELEAKKPVLEVKGLNTWFPSKTNIFGKPLEYVKAVNNVTFDIYPGETLGLVGESGCGKTTLGRTILKLVPAHSGKVFYDDKDLFSLSDAEMKRTREDMQIIFQDPYSSLNPRLTIGNAIMEPMQVHKVLGSDNERKDKVIHLLETVNMKADHFNRYPHEFSGGQRQRICIARALALNPKFIICDESVSALDVSVQAQVLNLLIQLRQEFEFTYIFISHDLSVVKFMSDRMIVMNQGEIEEMGPADEIYNNPQRPYTQKLIDAIPKGSLEDIKMRLG